MENNGLLPDKRLFSYAGTERLIDRFLCILQNPRDTELGVYDIDVVLTQIDERLFFNGDVLGVELLPIAILYCFNG